MPGSLLVAARQKTLVNAQSPRRSLQTSRNLGLIHTSQYKSKPSEELQRIFLTSSGGQSTSYLSISSANSSHLRLAPASTEARDRKSTRLNSSHLGISYAVFCL